MFRGTDIIILTHDEARLLEWAASAHLADLMARVPTDRATAPRNTDLMNLCESMRQAVRDDDQP